MEKWNTPVIEVLELNETANSTLPDATPDGFFGDIFHDGQGTDCSTICS